jgi:hypothetical protein
MSQEIKACPFCAEEILAAAQRCKHCNSHLNEENVTEASESSKSYDMFLLAIPLVGTMLVWFWISGLNLFQSPGSKMALILILVVLGTGIVAAMEAKNVGMTSDKAKGTYSSTSWFFIISLLWVVGYPAYLFKRRQFGLKNRLVPGLAVAVMFMGSWMLMNGAIEDKKAEVRAEMAALEQSLEAFGQ